MARELTKLHQEVWRGTLGGAVEWVGAQRPRGEIAIVLEGASEPSEVTDAMIAAALDRELLAGASRRDAVDAVSSGLSVGRRRVYRLAIDAATDLR